MFRKITILFYLFLCFFNTEAQYTEWSNEQKQRNKTSYSKIIGENDDGIFLLRSKSSEMSKNVFLEHYNPNMMLNYSKILIGSKNAKIVNTIIYQDTLVVYKAQTIKNQYHEIGLYRYSINENNEIASSSILLSTSPEKTFSDDGDFMVFESIDKSKTGLLHTEISKERNVIMAFDSYHSKSINKINSHKFELQFKYETIQIQQVEIDNDGNIYVILSNINKDEDINSNLRIQYYLYKYDVNGVLQDQILGASSIYMNRPLLEFDNKNNTLICAATFSDFEFGKTRGTRFLILQKESLKIEKSYNLTLSQSLTSSLIGKKRSDENQEVQNYYLKKIIPLEDGSAMVICEEFYISRQSYTYFVNGLAQVSARDIYNYGKIFLQRITPDGDVLWDGFIQRYQSSVVDMGYYGTFYTFVQKNEIDLYFNEEGRGYPEVFRYSIDSKGNIEKNILFKSSAGSIVLIPREGKQISYNAILFPVSKDRKFALLKLVF